MNTRFAIRVFAAVALATALGTACGGDASVGCRDSRVDSGPAGSLTQVTPCNITASPKVDLDNGDRIQVNSTGQAVVDVKGCGLIYVFQDSGLQRSACAESLVPAGSAYCALGGTSAMKNQCSNVLQLATPTSVVLVDGTYFAVSYDPESQISIISSFEDDVEVFPLSEVDGEILASTFINAGEFILTAPDDRLEEVLRFTGIRPREVTQLSELPGVVERLGFGPAYAQLVDQLREDGIDPGALIGGTPVFSVTAAGGAFGDPAFQEALTLGVEWGSRIESIEAQGIEVQIVFEGRPPVAAGNLEWDLRAGRELALSVVDGGYPVMVLAARSDGFAVDFAEALVQANPGSEFGEGGIEGLILSAELVIVGSESEAAELFESFVAQGTAVIWVGVG